MKNTLWSSLVLVTLFAISVRASAQVSLVEETGERLVLRMQVPNAQMRKVNIQGQQYVDYSINGFEKSLEPGAPSVPYIKVQLLIPTGKMPQLHVKNRVNGNAEVLPVDMAYVSRLPIHDGKRHDVARSAAAYKKVYGHAAVELEDVSFAGNEKIATLKFWPVRYDATKRLVQPIQLLDVEVSFTGWNVGEVPPVAGLPIGVAKYAVLNNREIRNEWTVNPKVDLVIAHTSHKATLQRYLDFKRSHGRRVIEHYVTNETKEQIKQILIDAYRQAEPPNDTLFVGNVDQIPAFYESSQGSLSDYKYQLLDAGEVPDISLGRVPAHDATELNQFIDKAINRETGSRNVGEVLLTAGRDMGLGCAESVTKTGENMKPGGVDVKITQKYMSKVSSQEVYDAYNNNPNIAVYDGHGNEDGMQEIPLLISNLNLLHNKVHPIILDIACLNANWDSGASRRNFAEMILLQKDAGSSGILASGGSGYGHDFFQTIGKTMAQARINLSADTAMNEIGRIVLVAKIKHGLQDRSFWNYYGDPASSVWEGTM